MDGCKLRSCNKRQLCKLLYEKGNGMIQDTWNSQWKAIPIGRAKCQKQTNLEKETMEKANEKATKPRERGVSKSLLITIKKQIWEKRL
jgi:hypothetical protein